MYKYHSLFFAVIILFVATDVSAATETVKYYSDEGSGGTTSDGRTFEDRFNSWSQTVNSLSARIAGSDDGYAQHLRNNIGNGNGADYYSINRLFFSFDINLPVEAKIKSAVFKVHGIDLDSSTGDKRQIFMVEGKPNDAGNLSVTDYSKVGNISYGVSNNVWKQDGWNLIPLNSDGLSFIGKGGVVSLALRGWYDFNNVVPDPLNSLSVALLTVEVPGTEFDPYLEITYEIPDPPVEEKYVIDLIRELIVMVRGYGFTKHIDNSYVANLKKVEGMLEDIQYVPAKKQVYAFVQKLKQDFKHKDVTQEQYGDLLAHAEALLGAMSDSEEGGQ